MDDATIFVDMHFVHGRGHAKITVNEDVDRLAAQGQRKQKRLETGGKIAISHKGVVEAAKRVEQRKREQHLEHEAKTHGTVA